MAVRDFGSPSWKALSIARLAQSQAIVNESNIDSIGELGASQASSVADRAESLATINESEIDVVGSIADRASSMARELNDHAIKSYPSSGEHQVMEIVRDDQNFQFKWESIAEP